MKQYLLALLTGLSAILAGCAAPTTQRVSVSNEQTSTEARKQVEMLAQDLMDDRARLQRVYWKLSTNAVDMCGRTSALIGVDLATKGKGDLAEANARLFGVGERPTVVGLSPGGPAEGAGFLKGDQLMSIDGIASSDAKAFAARMRQLENVGKPIAVEIMRAGQLMTLKPIPVKACGYPAILTGEQIVNAFADGDTVRITRGMMGFTRSDDELALVVAHEIAHDSMRHLDAKKTNAMGGLVADLALAILSRGAYKNSDMMNAASKSYSQEFEAEADYVGLYMLAKSGYSVDDAPKFWRRMATANPASIKDSHTSSHPSTPYRMVALEEAGKEIHDKRERGLPLLPQRKDGKPFVAGSGLMPGQ